MGIRNVPGGLDRHLDGLLRELRSKVTDLERQLGSQAGALQKAQVLVSSLLNRPPPSYGGGGSAAYGAPMPPVSLSVTPQVWAFVVSWVNPEPMPEYWAATEVWGLRSFGAWSGATTYLANAKVLSGGVVYRSVQGSNTNHAPASNPAWWEATTLVPGSERVRLFGVKGSSWTWFGSDDEALTPGETWAFWARNVGVDGQASAFVPNDEVGIVGTTLLDPGAYLELLTGSITESQLFADLGDRIDLIDGPSDLVDSVNARLAELDSQVSGALDDVVDGVTDITVTTAAGSTTLRALKTTTAANTAGIVAIDTVSSSSTSASAQALYGVRASVYDPSSGLASKASVTQLTQAKSDIYGSAVSQFTNISAQFTSQQASIDTKASLTQLNEAKSDIYGAAVSQFTNINAQFSSQQTSIDTKASLTQLNQAKSDIYGSAVSQFTNINAQFTSQQSSINAKAGVSYVDSAVASAESNAVASATQQVYTTLGGSQAVVQAKAQSWDGTSASYTVKIDNNGYVTGFGLASSGNTGTPVSEFFIRADKFAVISPSDTTNRTSPAPAANVPFSVQTTGQTINGVWVPAGVYIKSACIQDATITDAKINSLSASKLSAGTINASVITVTNLNAANITVGTINGSQISTGSNGVGTGNLVANAATDISRSSVSSYTPASISSVDNAVSSYSDIITLAAPQLTFAAQRIVFFSYQLAHVDSTPGWIMITLFRNGSSFISSYTQDVPNRLVAGSNVSNYAYVFGDTTAADQAASYSIRIQFYNGTTNKWASGSDVYLSSLALTCFTSKR